MRFLFLFLLTPILVSAQISPSLIVKANLSYNQVESSGDGLFGFEKDGKFGYMDKTEKVVIPAIYSYESETMKVIPSFTNGHVRLKKDGKYGIVDKTGKITIPFEYDYLVIYPLLSNHASFSRKENGKTLYGMVSLQNKPVFPAEYEQFVADRDMIVFEQNGKYGLADPTGKELIPAEFSSLTAFPTEGMLLAEKEGKYGIVDTKGNWLFEKQKSVYTILGAAQGLIRCKVNGKYGFLDKKGNEVIITRYDDATDFNTMGLSKVGQKKTTSTYPSHYGFIDTKGKEVIPIKYESIGLFYQGLAMVKDPETNRYGFLDNTGKWVIKPVYLDGLSFDEFGGCWVKMTDARYHYIDKTGKDYGIVDSTSYRNFNKDGYAVIANLEFPYVMVDKTGKVITRIDDCDGIYNFSGGLAGYKCKSNSLYGFLDVNANKVIPCAYASFTGFVEGVSRIQKKVNDKFKFGYINTRGETLVPAEYDDMQTFRNGWGLLKKDGNYFFVDAAGNLKEPPRKYDYILEFRSGLSLGCIKGTTGQPNTYYYINTLLKEEFSVSAKEAYSFWDDVAVVSRTGGYELLNKKGEVFKPLTGIDELKFSTDGMMAAKEKGKWGFIDNKGNWAIPAKYDSCDQFKNGYGRVRNSGKWGLVDKTGKEIFETKYENIYAYENGLVQFYNNGWGIADITGNILVPPTYYTITNFEKDRALARLGKSYTIIKSPLAK
jgi:hypothetical protein